MIVIILPKNGAVVAHLGGSFVSKAGAVSGDYPHNSKMGILKPQKHVILTPYTPKLGKVVPKAPETCCTGTTHVFLIILPKNGAVVAH